MGMAAMQGGETRRDCLGCKAWQTLTRLRGEQDANQTVGKGRRVAPISWAVVAAQGFSERCAMTTYTYTTLNATPWGQPILEGINDLGQVVGYLGTDGYLYSDGAWTSLFDPSGVLTEAEGINDLGQVVGGYADGNNVGHGFLFSNGAYTTLSDPSSGPNGTIAFGINDSGSDLRRIL